MLKTHFDTIYFEFDINTFITYNVYAFKKICLLFLNNLIVGISNILLQLHHFLPHIYIIEKQPKNILEILN